MNTRESFGDCMLFFFSRQREKKAGRKKARRTPDQKKKKDGACAASVETMSLFCLRGDLFASVCTFFGEKIRGLQRVSLQPLQRFEL